MDARLLDALGRAYGLPEPSSDDIVRVGPGTPGGELLRRYWQPIALSSDATDLPKEIRRFGEDLILFRNKKGEPGLLYPRCVHRGTSLFYGRVEEDGIRCCYHGWKFGNQGQCLDQPCEPERGRNKERLRQPWYPVVEKHGAIWAYMGPSEKQPLFPAFSIFEDLSEDEEVTAIDYGPTENFAPYPFDYNWFQAWDNVTDHYHQVWLHLLHSGSQFAGFADRLTGALPDVSEFKVSEEGNAVLAVTKRKFDDTGDLWARIEEAVLPNFMALPTTYANGPCHVLTFYIAWDDTTFSQIAVLRKKKAEDNPLAPLLALASSKSADGSAELDPNRKRWRDKTPEERQRFPHDYDAQSGQGKITYHSEEHLVTSDQGVSMQRRLFKQQCDIVAKGGDPIGVAFREEDRRVAIHATWWFEKAKGKESA